jgi:hypothetical protein
LLNFFVFCVIFCIPLTFCLFFLSVIVLFALGIAASDYVLETFGRPIVTIFPI